LKQSEAEKYRSIEVCERLERPTEGCTRSRRMFMGNRTKHETDVPCQL
jgi:hypothetical protein